jgi:hypothetical protein
MSSPSQSEAQVAFIAAAVVLLALPLLAAFGLAVLALATRVGIMSGMGEGARSETDWVVWLLFAAWTILVVVAALVFAVRFIRRGERRTQA